MTSMMAPTQQQQQASTLALQSAASSRGQDYLANPSAVLQRGVNDNDSYSTSQISFYNGVPSEDANGGGYSGLTQPAFSSQTYVDGKVYSDEELINIVMECVSDREKLAAVAAAISSAPYPKPPLPVTIDVEMRTHARVPYHAIPGLANIHENSTVLPRNPTAESISIPHQRFVPNGLPPSYEDTVQRNSARVKHAEQQDKTEKRGKRSRKGDGNKGNKRLKSQQQQPALNGHLLSTNGIIQGNIVHQNYAGATTSRLQYPNLLRLPPTTPLSIPTQHGPSPWIPVGSSQIHGLQHGTRYAHQNSPVLLGHRSLPLQEQMVPVLYQRRVPAPVCTPSPTRNNPLAPLQISQFSP